MADPATEVLRVLNETPSAELTDRYKIVPDIAARIAAHRPYQSEVDILERAILPKRAYEQLVTHIIEALGSNEAA